MIFSKKVAEEANNFRVSAEENYKAKKEIRGPFFGVE
jgi:hypothetical protein